MEEWAGRPFPPQEDGREINASTLTSAIRNDRVPGSDISVCRSDAEVTVSLKNERESLRKLEDLDRVQSSVVVREDNDNYITPSVQSMILKIKEELRSPDTGKCGNNTSMLKIANSDLQLGMDHQKSSPIHIFTLILFIFWKHENKLVQIIDISLILKPKHHLKSNSENTLERSKGNTHSLLRNTDVCRVGGFYHLYMYLHK